MTIDMDALKQKLEAGAEGLVGIFAGKEIEGQVAPFLFTAETGFDGLKLWPWYRVAQTISSLQKLEPDSKIGVVVRGCDERLLIELHKRHQVDLDKLVLFGVPCDPEEQADCFCQTPYPKEIVIGDKAEGAKWEDLDEFLEKPMEERLDTLRSAFDRCIKCYGCRNVCPMCFCHECTLEEDIWVDTGILPPPMASFHLIRAMHMAERCITCRECEAACPSNIPLTTLYRLMKRDMVEKFNYRPGMDRDEVPPINMKGVPEGQH